jgi:CRP-like cAMP-binding protein/FixJ family two-component response regulator
MKSTILLIDDDEPFRKNICEILKLADYNVLCAGEGKQGLELARKHHPDLVLSDITLPVLDGFGVLHAMQNIPELSAIPVVFFSGDPECSDFRTAMDHGADDFLSKPFSGDTLLKVVNTRLMKCKVSRKVFSENIERLKKFIDEVQTAGSEVPLPASQLVKKFRKKEFIFHEGDKAEYLYFVVSGKVKSFKTNYWGKEYITDIFKEGEFFGYLSLFDGNEQKESTMAIENSQIALISKPAFLELLHSNEEMADSFIRMLSSNLENAEEKLISQAYDSARKKVAEALIYISGKYAGQDNGDLRFPIHRDNISAVAGLSPESVSRNLTDLRKDGIIEMEGGNIRIVDIKKLESLKW